MPFWRSMFRRKRRKAVARNFQAARHDATQLTKALSERAPPTSKGCRRLAASSRLAERCSAKSSCDSQQEQSSGARHFRVGVRSLPRHGAEIGAEGDATSGPHGFSVCGEFPAIFPCASVHARAHEPTLLLPHVADTARIPDRACRRGSDPR